MKYVDEFRDPRAGKQLAEDITRLVTELERQGLEGPIKIMEVCGGHTHAIFKFGLAGMLPDKLELVHGPGCPVCVLPMGRVDDAITIAKNDKVIFTTFGDALRVPGSSSSLMQAKAEGADVRTVYSPVDALALARRHPDREVVFFGLGFETTTPSTALTILDAAASGVTNFRVFCNHIVIPPALRAILDTEDLDLAGFVGPGHVTMVIGTEPYRFVAEQYRKPLVISGFEPLDILMSIRMVLAQLVAGRPKVENQYKRVVGATGNPVALAAMAEVFRLRDHFEWRGLGSIPQSGLGFTPAYAHFDAETYYALPALSPADPKACECGAVLKGRLKPWDCKCDLLWRATQAKNWSRVSIWVGKPEFGMA